MQHESEAKAFARTFKIAGSLILFISVPGCIMAAKSEASMSGWGIAMGIGFVVFVIGRMMD